MHRMLNQYMARYQYAQTPFEGTFVPQALPTQVSADRECRTIRNVRLPQRREACPPVGKGLFLLVLLIAVVTLETNFDFCLLIGAAIG